MKITRLRLDAFRSYFGVELNTDASLVYVAGINNSGKTTLREAVKWALTGRCQVTDGKGAGVELLAPFDLNAQAEVELDIAGVGKVSRTSDEGLKVEGWTGTGATQQHALYERLTASPAFLDAVLDSGAYLALHHAEAKALVLSLLDVKLQLGDAVYNLTQWDGMYDKAFGDRKVAKQRLKDFRMPSAPPDVPRPSLGKVDEQLALLKSQVEGLTREVGETIGTRQALMCQQSDAKVRETYRAALDYEAVVGQLALAQERLRQLERGDEDVEASSPTAGKRLQLESTIGKLVAHKPTDGCVIDCAVECKTAKLAFTRRAKELRAEVEAMPEEPAVLPGGMTPRETLQHDIRDLTRSKEQYERVQRINEEREIVFDRVTKELEALPDTSTQEQSIGVLKERITKGEALRQEVLHHQQAVEAMKTAETTRQTLQTTVNKLEELVQVLGPNGARVEALANSLGVFTEAVNRFTGPFGWTVAFSVDPWDVEVNGRSIRTYSRSEQFRLGIALQLAIAHLSGLKFAIVDELDMLDAANRATMTALLVRAGLEQIIVLATREPSQGLPVGDGIVSYRVALQSGRSVIAERSAA